jgi:GrpB-like predicted nucleotidyltransferase (UPF0157 family)
VLDVEYFVSTAIPGMAARPTIDILVAVSKFMIDRTTIVR